MANFSPSNWQKAMAKLTDKYAKPENRFKPAPVLQLGLKNRNALIPGHEAIRTREDRSVSAYLLARSKRAAGSGRVHNHSGSRGDSIEQALTWNTYSDKFSISLKQMDNNIFGFTETLSQQIENACKNILESLETALVTSLQGDKTEINAALYNGTFNAANDTFEITEQNRFFQMLKSMMRQNNYSGQFDVVANSIAFANAEYLRAQGSGNSTNTNFQLSGMNIVESYELTDANYPDSDLVLAFEQGAFATLPWIPKQNREGEGDFNSVLGGYGSFMDPFGLGLELALHGYTERADTSAANGVAQDNLMQFEISVDIAAPVSPLSVATETPIFQAARV